MQLGAHTRSAFSAYYILLSKSPTKLVMMKLSVCFALFTVFPWANFAAKTADDYVIHSLPGFPKDINNTSQHAGMIEVNPESDANMFFWLTEDLSSNSNKLIIWLNGGPGCSSMDGLFLENGPYRVNKDLSLSYNPGAWHQYAAVVYVDQPVGTGFSYVQTDSYLTNITQITDYFVMFLDRFFEIFPNHQKRDLYIAGESFAGIYIPYFASRLILLNSEGSENPGSSQAEDEKLNNEIGEGDYMEPTEDEITDNLEVENAEAEAAGRYTEKRLESPKYNLKGIAIGNGWMDSVRQYDAYYDFAISKGLLKGDYQTRASRILASCQQIIKVDGERIRYDVCERVLSVILDSSVKDENGTKMCINQYDIRFYDTYAECGLRWPYELEQMTEFLRTSEVKEAVHVPNNVVGWNECRSVVGQAMDGDESEPSYKLLPKLLESTNVLLFSGDQDLICNHFGTEWMIGNLTWQEETGFGNASTENWYIDDKTVGQYTVARNLQYVLITNASHMAPYDKPIELLDMINRFMGVGNGTVNGLKSWVGEKSTYEPTTKPTISPAETTKESNKVTNPVIPSIDENETNEASIEEPAMANNAWARYYNWGTIFLLVVVASIIGFAFFWIRNRKAVRQGGNNRGLFASLVTTNGRPTFRDYGDDEINEMEELVVEDPTIFNADEYDSHDESGDREPRRAANNSDKTSETQHFMLGEGSDDEDEEFRDFQDAE